MIDFSLFYTDVYTDNGLKKGKKMGSFFAQGAAAAYLQTPCIRSYLYAYFIQVRYMYNKETENSPKSKSHLVLPLGTNKNINYCWVIIVYPSVADPDPVGSGLFGSGSGFLILKKTPVILIFSI